MWKMWLCKLFMAENKCSSRGVDTCKRLCNSLHWLTWMGLIQANNVDVLLVTNWSVHWKQLCRALRCNSRKSFIQTFWVEFYAVVSSPCLVSCILRPHVNLCRKACWRCCMRYSGFLCPLLLKTSRRLSRALVRMNPFPPSKFSYVFPLILFNYKERATL